MNMRKLFASGLFALVLVGFVVLNTLSPALGANCGNKEWEEEYIAYRYIEDNLGTDPTGITGMIQLSDGDENGYMIASIVFDGPGTQTQTNLHIGLSVNDDHGRFDVFIGHWEIEGEDSTYYYDYVLDYDKVNNIHHRLMFQVYREDAYTIDVKLWDCDAGDTLIFHEDISIDDPQGTGVFTYLEHILSGWCWSFDCIGRVEFHKLYSTYFQSWVDMHFLSWEDEGWYGDESPEHLRGDHYHVYHDCDPIEGMYLGERLGLYSGSGYDDPWDDVPPLYSGDAVHQVPDSLIALPPPHGLKAVKIAPPGDLKYTPHLEGSTSCSPVGSREESTGDEWSRVLFWYTSNVPTPTATATNTATPTATATPRPTLPPPTKTATPLPTCTPTPQPTQCVGCNIDIEINLPLQDRVNVGWYRPQEPCGNYNPRIKAAWRGLGTPCPPLPIVATVTALEGNIWVPYGNGTPAFPAGKRACVVIQCRNMMYYDTDQEYLMPPPLCTGWEETAGLCLNRSVD